MNTARLFFVGGLLAYRGLFRWLTPSVFVPTMIGIPIFQMIFFVLLGRSGGSGDDTFYAIGNAVQSCAMAGLFASTMAIANERFGGTLEAVLATPSSRMVVFGGRLVPPALTGMAISTIMLTLSVVLFDVRIPPAATPVLMATVVACSLSTSALGLTLGALGLRYRDAMFLSNLVLYAMLLLCGTNVPLDELPYPLRVVSELMPLTHGLRAGRDAIAGAPAYGAVGVEFLVAGAYLMLALAMLGVYERGSRRHATLERV